MKRAKRFLAQLALLPVLLLINAIDRGVFQALVVLSIVVIWPISVAVALILVWLSREAERLDGPIPESMVETTDNAVTNALQYTGLVGAVVLVYWLDRGGGLWFVALSWSIMLGGFSPTAWLRTLRLVWWPMIQRRSNGGK